MNGADYDGWRENGLRCCGTVRLMKAGEGVCFDILITRTVSDGEVEPSEVQGPPGLARVESFSILDIF